MKRLLILFFIYILTTGIWIPQALAKEEKKQAYELGKIVVTGTRTQRMLKDTPVRTEIITSKEIKESGAKTLLEVLGKNLVGIDARVQCSGCNFSTFRLQGLESDYTQVLIDGQPVFGGLAGVYGLEQLQTENIEKIEVIKGASSALYGSNAIGGVINIITKEPPKNKTAFSLKSSYGNHNTYNISSTGSLRKGNIAGIFTLQKNQNDYFDQNNDNFTDKVQRDNHNLSLKTHIYLLEDKHRLTVLGRNGHEVRKFGSIPALPVEITTNRNEYGIGYRALLGTGSIFNLTLSTSSHKRNLKNPTLQNDANEDISVVETQYSHPLAEEKHILTSGITYKNEGLEEIINSVTSPKRYYKSTGIYFQDEINARENVKIVLGCRYDNTKSTFLDDSAISPRIGVKWEATEAFSWRASIGSGFKIPYLFYQKLHVCPTAPLIYRDPQLRSEKALSYSFGGEYIHGINTLELNLFFTEINKKIFLSNTGAPAGYDYIIKNGGNAYTLGLETNARIRPSNLLALKLGFGITDARFKEKQDPAIKNSEFIRLVPQMTGLLGIECRIPKPDFKINLNGRLVGNMYIENKIEGTIDKTPIYTVWDIRAEKEFQDNRYTLFLGVDNLFDYVQPKRYTVAQDSTYVYAPLTGRYIYGGVKVTL